MTKKKFIFIIYYKQDKDGYYMFDTGAGYKTRSYSKTNIKTLQGLKNYLKPSLKGFEARYIKGK